ncbi:MAG TPA: IS66 family transposase [Solirubrobacteraceae bacterium]
MTDHATPLQLQQAAGVREMLAKMFDEGRRDEMLGTVTGLLEKLLTQNTQLEWRLQAALRQLYRKRSEKISPDQLAFFLAQIGEAEAAKANVETAPPTPPTIGGASDDQPAAQKKSPPRAVRKPLPAHLRREIRKVPLLSTQTCCESCGATKQSMGIEIRNTLEFRPAELFVIEEHLAKAVCKKCEEGVVIAAATPKPIDGGRPGPGLLAKLLVDKYEDSTPLYRQAKEWGRLGFELPTSTMGDWVAAAADLLEPLWKVARADTLGRTVISLDDTHMPVLDRDHPHGIKKGHLWMYIGDVDEVLFCEYTPTWEGDGPCRVLANFTGKYVQADGYAGINAYFDRPGAATRVGCGAHARRKFVAALEAKDLRAAVPVALFAQLYAVEAKAREENVGLDELLARRRHLSRPVMDRLSQVIKDLRGQAEPKSPLGKAITYAINQWSTLIVFLEDARVPIDNLHVERRHRPTALGRRNYLFCGSDEGARRHAIISTLLGNCAIVGANPFDYLRDVIGKLAGVDWPAARLAELMPAPWAAAAHKKSEQPNAE